MNIPVIPPIKFHQYNLKLVKIKASQYGKLENLCFYKTILQKCLADYNGILLPFPASAYTGTVAHNILELTLNGKITNEQEFEQAWDKQIKNKELELIKKHPGAGYMIPLRDYEKKFRTKLMVMKICKSREQRRVRSGYRLGVERSFEEVDYLEGRIDLISYEENFVEITDYKTGLILNENDEIKPLYQLQLKLYAILFQKMDKRLVDKLSLINLAGEKYNVPFSQAELGMLFNEVKTTLQQINKLIDNNAFESLANIEADNCKYCQCRPACEYYWRSTGVNQGDLQGVFLNAKIVQDGTVFLNIESGGNNFFIKGLVGYSLLDFDKKQGESIRVLNVFQNKQPHLSSYYQATKATALFWN